ncbi:MAG: hypothetical protein LLG42_06035 [Chloroflexi bacterium]|nr:hypothetical protein [Chloroflexota bacterium]
MTKRFKVDFFTASQEESAQGHVSAPSPFITGSRADASLSLSMTMRGMFPYPAHSSPALGRMLVEPCF